jgi:catechol 2,3-dioxygenase-like lactoylglutathione lyase family enzyme
MPDRIDHVAIVVGQLDEAQSFLSTVMNMALVREYAIPERSLRTAFYRCGSVEIELIEVSDPDARKQRLGDAIARIEHIAIQVDDIRLATARLQALGVELVSPPQLLGGRLVAATKATSSMGVMFQLLQELSKSVSG